MSKYRTVHTLKTLAPFYYAVMGGEKTFEIRKNDRQFQKGDLLVLDLYEPDAQTKNSVIRPVSIYCEVTWVLAGGQFGIEPGYAGLAIRNLVLQEFNELRGPF
ncbi:ASCH domain-containing protein [Rhizobium phage RHph_TM40]|nr:ASCH domain-containing protein [Rhizobium phage RHph_TM40]QIG72132.1 ASCH domain-containing protein [Rhizobium phage RHph_TM2_3B]QIG72494.1 ASCH domain-containing protein [Rhizobium phage RHph_TM3_3_6]QIG77884.1 ASCH domain-containing protein [Rhizobium phage RHph_TM61]